MATLNIKDEQVIDLISQRPPAAKADALRTLLADAEWDSLLAYEESRLDDAHRRRGLDRSGMTPEQTELVIEEIAEGR
jgi:hypothetical protein